MSQRKFTKEQFENAVKTSSNIAEVLTKLDLVPSGSSYKRFYGYVASYNIDVSSFRGKLDNDQKSKRNSITGDEIAIAVKNGISFRGVLTSLMLTASGVNNQWIRKKIVDMKLDITHFAGQAHMAGKTHNYNANQLTPLKDILIEESYYNCNKLKKRLIKEGLLQQKCAECGITDTWNGKPIVLHMDHINGNNIDNRIENLRLLCPNCHSQTDTYAGKNKKAATEHKCKECGKISLKERLSGLCKECFVKHKTNNPLSHKNVVKNKFCAECSDPLVSYGAIVCKARYNIKRTKYQSPNHNSYITKIVWPSKEELQKLLWEIPTQQLAKQLGVSDNAIAKHAKKLGLNKPSRGYWRKKETGKIIVG